MLTSWRLWFLAGLVAIAAVLAGDWAMSRARLDSVTIETTLETPSVMADGKHTATFLVRVSEAGKPRTHDLIQIWLVKGTGQLVPQWAFSDEQGVARVSFTPAPYNRYDPQGAVQIAVMDTSIGRLIEVGKQTMVSIPLVKPDGQ